MFIKAKKGFFYINNIIILNNKIVVTILIQNLNKYVIIVQKNII